MANKYNQPDGPQDQIDATILLVDDTPENLRLLTDYLSESNYRILVARSGASALKRFEFVRPDIILLDVIMPEMDGFELCAKLKDSPDTSDIPVIFMTALTNPEDKTRAFDAGAVDFITKPIQKEEVLARVKTHLKIAKYQELLEQEVKERTRKLHDQMQELSHEIKEREDAEAELLKLRNYQSSIIDSMPSILIGVDPAGTITQWNTQAAQSTGCNADMAIGGKLDKIFPHLAKKMDLIRYAIANSEVHTESKQAYLKNEQIRYEDITIYPLGANGVQGAVIRVDDVTDRVQIENMMIQTEKMSSIAGLAAGMAHEINNPLAVITQGIQNIIRRLDPSREKNIEIAQQHNIDLVQLNQFLAARKIDSFLDGGRNAVKRAAAIVKNMLLFSRQSGTDKLKTDLAQLLDNAIELGSTDYDMNKKYDFKFIDIIKEYDKQTPAIMCCPSEIEQVLLNLFKNALQAMEEVKEDGYKPQFHIRLKKEQKFVCIEIEDNGPGITNDVKPRIFEPFFTTKPVGIGTGLGLSVSYMIITQNHGGTFEVESETAGSSEDQESPARGMTKFIIRLPI